MPLSQLLPVLAGVAAGLLVALIFILVYTRRQRRSATSVLATARTEADRLRADAVREAEASRSEMLVAARIESLKLREDIDREIARRREEWERLERRADERSRAQEKKAEELEGRDRTLNKRDESIAGREAALKAREGEADRLAQEQRRKLERIAGLTAEDARREVLQSVEDEARGQAAALARDIKEQARRGADRDARRILSIAIQRLAAEHTTESTVSAVALPSDEMKGRIIGREGRNIRAFEIATGVDVIIDDTPDTVVVSCFDPIRREVARRALEALDRGRADPPGSHRGARGQGAEGARGAARRAGRAGRLRHGHPRPASRDDQAHRPDALSHLLRPEHLRPLEGSGVARRDDGGRARISTSTWPSAAGCCTTWARCSPTSNEGTHVELGVEVARRYGENAAVMNCIRPTTTTCRTRARSRCSFRPPTRSAARDRGPGAKRSRPT